MKTFPVLLLLVSISALISHCAAQSLAQGKIKHVVVLMFENRAFDHMLGHLKKVNPNIDGLTGNEFNYVDPSDPHSQKVKVTFDCPLDIGLDPDHSVVGTEIQLWGSKTEVTPAPMSGFVADMLKNGHNASDSAHVMRCYNSTSVSVISNLATDFAVFDRWYSSIPGPTTPNRLYAMSGTSHGNTVNIVDDEVDGYPQRCIFDDLYDSGLSFGVYFSDFPVALMLKNLRDYPDHLHTVLDFYDHAKSGNLPAFSWLEPRWFDFLDWKESDEHPRGFNEDMMSSHITFGELFLKDVYESLRASPAWNETLLIVTYDEHGGLYDHVPPPQSGVPNPDGLNSTNPPFAFDRLGIRVPTIAISPWIDANTVVHEPGVSHFDHTSTLGTLRKLFPFKQGPLTKREAWSATYEDIVNLRDTPRTDCPTTVPISPYAAHLWDDFVKTQRTPDTPENIEKAKKKYPLEEAQSPEMSDLQKEIVNFANWIAKEDGVDVNEIKTVYQGATFVRQQLEKFLTKTKK